MPGTDGLLGVALFILAFGGGILWGLRVTRDWGKNRDSGRTGAEEPTLPSSRDTEVRSGPVASDDGNTWTF